MTKRQWKNKLVDLLMSEPETGEEDKGFDKAELLNYLDELEEISDSFYGVANEIIIGIEKHLNK